MSHPIQVPKIEDLIEFNTNRHDPNYGTPQLTQRKKDLVIYNPEFYLDPLELHTEKYNWEIIEDLHYYQYHDVSRPNTAPDAATTPLRWPKGFPFDEQDRPKTATSDTIILGNVILPKFEIRRQEMMKAGRILKKANQKLGPKRLILPSIDTSIQLPQRFYDETIIMNKEMAERYEHSTTLKSRIRMSIDHVPILKAPYIFQSEEIAKSFAARTFPSNSVCNIWQDSDFPLSKETSVTIQHLETCVYRNTRKYGYVFEEKEVRRKQLYEKIFPTKKIVKRNSVLRRSTMTSNAPESEKLKEQIIQGIKAALPSINNKPFTVDNEKSPVFNAAVITVEQPETQGPPALVERAQSNGVKPTSSDSPKTSQVTEVESKSNSRLNELQGRETPLRKQLSYLLPIDVTEIPDSAGPDTLQNTSNQPNSPFKRPRTPKTPLKLALSRASTANSSIFSEPLSARTPLKENPLLIPEPLNIEIIRQSFDYDSVTEGGGLNLLNEKTLSSPTQRALQSKSPLHQTQDRSAEMNELLDENQIPTIYTDIRPFSRQKVSDPLILNGEIPEVPSFRSPAIDRLTSETPLERKLTPVAFSFNDQGMISDIHYQSLVPKKRPNSANRLLPESRQSLLLSSPSKLQQYEEFLKSQQQQSQFSSSDLNDTQLTKDLLAVSSNLSTAPAILNEPIKPFIPHYLRLDKPRRANTHRKDLNKIHFITEEEKKSERAALMAIFDSCSGDDWKRSDNWGSTMDVRYWYGVGVTVEGYVFELNLPNNNLNGKFPDNLMDFPQLEVINVDHNQLYGLLPEYCLAACDKLKILSATYNQLEGSLPFNYLSDLRFLKEIWLNNNQFTGPLEDGLYDLISLTHLCLDQNQLTGSISPRISKLQKLKYLSFGRNQLTGVIPQSIVGLQDLEVLSLHTNDLEGKIPMFIDMIPRLDELRLYGNPRLIDDVKSIVTVKSAVKKKDKNEITSRIVKN